MEKMNLQELRERKASIYNEICGFENRELTAEETVKYETLKREFDKLGMAISIEKEAREAAPEAKTVGEQYRESLQGAKNGEVREIIVGTTASPGAGLNSGAIPLTIKDVLPNLEEGTGLPAECPIVGGVIGDVVFPTDASDMEMEEVGEVASLNDQTIDFQNVKAAASRIGLSYDISYKIIDNLHFDIQAHCAKKQDKAWRKFWAKKIYSQANWSGIKGPWANATVGANDTITIGANAASQILSKVAAFLDKGLDAEGCAIVIDATTEAILKATPVALGQGGFCIQNGKLLGYNYVVTHYINTVLGGDSKTDASHTDTTKLYATTDRYLGIGFFNYLKPQQHGDIRLSYDGTSKAQAKKGCVGVVLNTEVSLTDLSKKLYDEAGNVVSAFGIYKLIFDDAPSSSSVMQVKVVNTAASPVKVAGSVTVDNTTEAPVNTKEVTA